MKRYAILCGSAPDGYRQKKLIDTHSFLTSTEGGSLPEERILIFPNGVQELLLEMTLNSVMETVVGDGESADSVTASGSVRDNSDCACTEGDTETCATECDVGDGGMGGCEVLLYFCARSDVDLNALSEYEAVGFGHLPVVKLGVEEIRKEVIEYYEKSFAEVGVKLRVVYEADDCFVSEESLGWEKVLFSHSDFISED